MGRSAKKVVILAGIESVYSTDPGLTGAANTMVVSNLTVNPLNAKNVERNIIRGYQGSSESLVGVSYKEVSFDIEFVGSGTAGVAPAWGPLLRACGFAEVSTATIRVDYTPISDQQESITLYYYRNGVVHKLLGCRGNVNIRLSQGEKPMLSFKFQGLHPVTNSISVGAVVSTTTTSWRVPQVVTAQNTGFVTFGGTHATGTAPALVGGTLYPSTGITVDMGSKLGHLALVGQGAESMELGDRNPSGAVRMQLTPAQEVALYNQVLTNGLGSVGIRHGTNPGDRVLLFMPSVQLTDPTEETAEETLMNGYKIGPKPVAGNDEVRIVTSF